jgi:LysM repeat protein
MQFLTYPQHPKARTFISFTLIALMLLSVGVAAAIPKSTTASYVDVLTNGGFEHGFVSQPGCGMVGYGWHCFTNGGNANYGFYDDQWEPVVAEGHHSQLIEINNKGIIDGDPDRYAGLYQTVRVVDWENYQLHLRGMIRTTNLDGDPYRYQVQVGWTAGAHADWQAVTNWEDTGWYTYYDRLEPGAFSDYSTHIMAEDDYITVYVRVWKKWPSFDEEIDINLDAISLTGPSPYHHGWGAGGSGGGYGGGYSGGDGAIVIGGAGGTGHGYGGGDGSVVIIDGKEPGYAVHPEACKADYSYTEYIYNGGFEHGFNPIYLGHVGKNWGFFTNGGNAGYGFYDEQWDPVVTSGEHGQLIEINMKGILDGDNQRYAGIYQHVRGLTPGQTYELSLRGMLRGVGGGEDPYRFEADWGYNWGYDADWTHVDNWQHMDLGEIYPRTEPVAMGAYSVKFVAPSHEITLFIRGQSKWAITDTELDFNLDDISLTGCGQPAPCLYDGCSKPIYPVHPVQPIAPPVTSCTYTVQPGDSLSMIAARYGVTTHALQQANDIYDPNMIYVGQVLSIPGCGVGHKPVYPVQPIEYPVAVVPPARPVQKIGEPTVYVVKPGDTFSAICKTHGVDAHTVASHNGIYNTDVIYIGQEIVIP